MSENNEHIDKSMTGENSSSLEIAKLAKQQEKELKLYDKNHEAIRISYAKLIQASQKAGDRKPPTISAIAKDTGLNWKTIKKHIGEIKTEVTGSIVAQVLFEDVLLGMAMAGRGGDVKAARLFFEVTGHLAKESGSIAPNGSNGGAAPTIGTINIQVIKNYGKEQEQAGGLQPAPEAD